MLNQIKLNDRNLALVKDIVKMSGGRMTFTRRELQALHKQLRGRICSPYFITKNTQGRPSAKDAKDLPRGTFTVERFIKYATQHAPTGKRESKAKRESATPTTRKRRSVAA